MCKPKITFGIVDNIASKCSNVSMGKSTDPVVTGNIKIATRTLCVTSGFYRIKQFAMILIPVANK
jgi:hypothetical protein